MDIMNYYPFTEVSNIPPDYIMVVDTGKIMKRKEATPKNIGKGYTFVGDLPLLASIPMMHRLREAKRLGNIELLPKDPKKDSKPKGEVLTLPIEIRSLILNNLPLKDIVSFLSTKRELRKYTDDPELWKLLLQRDYPDVVLQYDDKNKEKYMVIRNELKDLKKINSEYTYSKNVLRVMIDNKERGIINGNISDYIEYATWKGRLTNNEIGVGDLLPALWGTYRGKDRDKTYLSVLIQDAYNILWKVLGHPDILDSIPLEETRLISEVFFEVSSFINYIGKILDIKIMNKRKDILAMGPEFIEKLRKYSRWYGNHNVDKKKLKELIDSVPSSNKIDVSKFKEKLKKLNSIPLDFHDKDWAGAINMLYPEGRLSTMYIW